VGYFYWCSILELVRTHFAACGGKNTPPRAAPPRRLARRIRQLAEKEGDNFLAMRDLA